ncbi:MAG: nucleotide sugar dehydrogenase [Acidobacteriaceae bacterium]
MLNNTSAAQNGAGGIRLRIAVIGSGYVGLVVAACFAEIGHAVVCVDSDAEKIAALQSGHVPIHEDLLPELLERHRGKRLTFTTSMHDAVKNSAVIVIAVGTPSLESGEADLTCVEQAAYEVAQSVDSYKVIVEKSTVPVATSESISQIMIERGVPRKNFEVVSNPEFLREGTAVINFLHPDRIVVGTHSDRAYQVLERVYQPLTSGTYFESPSGIPGPRSTAFPAPMLRTSAKSGELIKQASNAFLAMKISFINSVANICEAVDASITEVATGIGMDERIGPQFLSPGLGYGGSCFHKDVKAFRSIGVKTGVDLGLLYEIQRINDAQRLLFFKKVQTALKDLCGKKLGVLGLAFKGGTDDIRESPAIHLIRSFLDEGCLVVAHDPAATKNARAALPSENLTFVDNPYQTMDMADALVILTDWPEFSELDLPEMKRRMKRPLVLDGRNLFDDNEMAALGFTYISVGKPSKPAPSPARAFVSKSKQRVLVTGAAGFLGSNLVDALIAEGHSVLGVDNFLTGRQKNLDHLRTEPRFELLEHDITTTFDPGRVDLVFNMASPASPIDYTVHGVETMLAGSLGTHNVLDIARKYDAPFLHCSTSECYGDPLVHPQPESYWGHVNPIGPRSVYDESKRFSEALIMAYHRYYNLDTRLVRIFNTYGPRLQLNDGRVISNFLRQALSGENLTVYGDGSQTRSFCYVSDQIDGLMRLMASGETDPVNIGNPEEFTILECAKQVLAATGAKSKIVFRPLPQDDPKQRCPDITRAREILGWEPKVNLASGLQLSIPWFREILSTTPAPVEKLPTAVAETAAMLERPIAS